MTGANIKALLEKCNDFCTNALNTAAGTAVRRTNYEVTIEHFLLACLTDASGDIPVALEKFNVDTGRLARSINAVVDDFQTGNTGRPVFSPLLLELLESSWIVASVDMGLSQIRSLAFLAAFIQRSAVYAQGNYTESVSVLNKDVLLKAATKIAMDSKETTMALEPGTPSGTEGSVTGQGQAGESFIAKYCDDFTEKAKAGKIDPVFGRDQEIRQMVDILARRRKNNPILVGEPGVGKTAVLEGLALRITEGDVPDVLQGVSLIAMDLGRLEAGAGMKGEFERRLKGLLDEIKSSEKSIILFIDEAHMLVGAGGQAGGADAANLMKPALARGEIRTCAATTWKEYKKYFEKDPALSRRFQLVKLDEPSVKTAALILRGIRAGYEKSHKVLIRDDAIEAAASMSNRYITGRFLPDKAIDLLDTACARVKVSLSSKPAALEDIQRATQALQRELNGLVRDKRNGVQIDEERVGTLEAKIAEYEKQAADLEHAWKDEKKATEKLIQCRSAMLEAADTLENANKPSEEAASKPDKEAVMKQLESTASATRKAFEKAKAELDRLRGEGGFLHVEVTADVIAQVVSDWTGIPVGRMAEEQAGVVKDLEQLMGERIKGQPMALKAIAETMQASSAGLRSPDQPMGVFLLVGPSGVGKTESGLVLADLLFGDEHSAVSINMSEFQEKHTVSRLIGSPPGYVGYGEGGMLTEAVRRRPYSVVLLDEVEKAHADVMNLFYQVFDKGVLTDGEGKEVSFRNTVIMLTSNLASDLIQEFCSSNPEGTEDELTSLIRPSLSEYFRPALLARMRIVPYRSLQGEALQRIAELKVCSLAKRLMSNNGMRMTYSEKVPAQIAARCTETETGARNIDYILNGSVLPRLTRSILEHMSDGAMPQSVHIDVADDGSFTMAFK